MYNFIFTHRMMSYRSQFRVVCCLYGTLPVPFYTSQTDV